MDGKKTSAKDAVLVSVEIMTSELKHQNRNMISWFDITLKKLLL